MEKEGEAYNLKTMIHERGVSAVGMHHASGSGSHVRVERIMKKEGHVKPK